MLDTFAGLDVPEPLGGPGESLFLQGLQGLR